MLKRKTLFKQNSNFYDYVKGNERIRIHSFPSFYPEILNNKPRGILHRFIYNLAKYMMQLISSGTPYDRALIPGFWLERIMWKRAQRIKAKYIIVSGAPFKLCYFATRNRKKYNIPVIVDFRDPWTWGKAYGFILLGKKRFEVEKRMERITVENADLITVPAEPMLDYLKKTYPEHYSKMVLLKHGFDQDLIVRHDFNRFKGKAVINLIHLGTIRDGIDAIMTQMAEVLLKAQGKIKLTFYTDENKYEQIFLTAGLLGTDVNYKKTLSQKEFFGKMGEFDFVFMAHPFHAKDDLVTKVYEIVYSKTPIIYVGDSGLLSEFLTKNHCGLYFNPAHVSEDLTHEFLNSNIHFEGFAGIEEYSFEKLTDYFLEKVEEKLRIE